MESIGLISNIIMGVTQIIASGALVFFTWRLWQATKGLWQATDTLASVTKTAAELQYHSQIVTEWGYDMSSLNGTYCTPHVTIKDKRGLPLRIVSVYKGRSDETTVLSTTKDPSGAALNVTKLRREVKSKYAGFRLDEDPVDVHFSPIRSSPNYSDYTLMQYEILVLYRDCIDNQVHSLQSICTYMCHPEEGIKFLERTRSYDTPTDWEDDPNLLEIPGSVLFGAFDIAP